MSDWPTETLVPPGDYRVAWDTREREGLFRRKVDYCHLKITEPGEHFGKRLLRVYNVHSGPRPLPRTHNMRRDYVNLTGRRPPSRGLKPEDFLKGREMLARVRTVVRDFRQRPIPLADQYSVIDEFIEYTAGQGP